MKTALAVCGGLLGAIVILTGGCAAVYAVQTVMAFDDKIDLANNRLKVLLKYEGVNKVC